jgi:cobaltochelatase CobT
VFTSRRADRTLARACYDAVERVRYEALGSRGYAGMQAISMR